MNRSNELAIRVVLGMALAGVSTPSGAVAIPPHKVSATTTTRHTASPVDEVMRTPMREPGVFGGRFVLAVTSDARTFNPVMVREASSSDVCDRLFTALDKFDNRTQQYGPALASSWNVSPDQKTWTWHLRRGARFSDGRPITAADVLFSFQVATDTTVRAPIGDGLLVHGEPIRVTAPDPYTIVTRISEPFGLMPAVVASVPILPRHVLARAFAAGRFASSYGVDTRPESLVSSGPWMLERYVPHERTVLARNPHWFGVDVRGRRLPYLDEVVLISVPDQNTAALKFLSRDGEVDGLDNIKPEDYLEFANKQAAGAYTLYDLGPNLTSNFFWFNLNTAKAPDAGSASGPPVVGPVKYAWFSNRDFRRAVSKAIDRDAMIRAVFFGEGSKNWSFMTPGNKVFHDPATPAYDFDPEGAKRLLAQNGFKDTNGDSVLEDPAGNPVRFVLKTNANSNLRMQLANFVRDDLARVGLQCTLAGVDPNTMVGNIQNNFDYDAALGGLGTTIPPDPAMGASVYRSSGSTHFWNVGQPRPRTAAEARLDSLFEAITASRDLAVRQRISGEMDRIIGDECWVIWLPVNNIKIAARNRFGNLEPSSIRHRLLWNIETVFVRPSAH